MPYHVAKTGDCPTSKPWGVIKDSDGEVMGCHATKGEANDQLAAIHANEDFSDVDSILERRMH